MNYTRLNVPEELPATAEQIDSHTRVGLGHDAKLDAQATRCVMAAMREIEDHSGIALFRQEIRVNSTHRGPILDLAIKGNGYRLPIGPGRADDPVSISIISVDGPEFVLDPTQFVFWGGPRPILHLVDDGNLPQAIRHVHGRMVVHYWAGLAQSRDDIPDDLRHAILDQASLYLDAGWDMRRGHNGLSPHTARIAARYRRVGFD